MIKKLRSLVIAAAAVFAVAAPIALPATVSAGDSANIKDNLCGGANLQTGESKACNEDTGSFSKVLSTIINIFSLVVGIVAVIMVIIGGFNYITSGGNEGKVSTAKNTILYAVIGLIIVAFAQALVRFVINKTS